MRGVDAVELAPQSGAEEPEAPVSERPIVHLDEVKRQRDEAVEACTDLGMQFAKQTVVLIGARRERDQLKARLIAQSGDLAFARALLEKAMHLCRHGENAPGGSETWAAWYERAETFARALDDVDAVLPGALFGRDAGLEWHHEGSCSWPERACTGHLPSYPPVRVPENTGKHPAESGETGDEGTK